MATLAEQYRQQARWRSWDQALLCLPIRPRQRVLDLGCGVGDICHRLHQVGCEVIGVDANPELLEVARRQVPGVRFAQLDLRLLKPETFGPVDGIWSSFVAAYFTDLEPKVRAWADCLKPNGWLALVEMEDLLGHEPLQAELKQEVGAFYEEARIAGRYDFLSGSRLVSAMGQAGLIVMREELLPDQELAFNGPANDAVMAAWQDRLARMGGLKNYFGSRFDAFQRAFLGALASKEHRSSTKVRIVVATKG